MERRALVRLFTAGFVGLLIVITVAGGALAVGRGTTGVTRQISTVSRTSTTVARGAAVALAPAAERATVRSNHGPFARGLAAGGGGTPTTAVLLLYINNTYAATLQAVDGCTSYADATDQGGGDHTLGRELIPDPCVLRHTSAVQANFIKFLDAQLNGNGGAKEVEVALADGLNKTIIAAVAIESPLISRFVVPGGDAASQSPASFVTTITGSSILPIKPELVFPASPNKTRPALLSNFAFSFDGAKEPGVKSTSPMVFKREVSGKPGSWAFSDYQVVTSYGKPGTFPSWYNKSVLNGPVEQERSAKLEYLKADLSAPLFTLNLPVVGLFRADGGFDIQGGRHWTMYVDAADVSIP